MSRFKNEKNYNVNQESTQSKLEFLRLRLSCNYPLAKVIPLVSSKTKEGKTFLADQLATSLINLGYKTLVINGNMLEESKSDSNNDGNLNKYLNGENSSVKIKKAENTYDFLDCNFDPQNSSKLLNSDKYAELIQRLRDQYDYILIDTPAFEQGIDGFLLGKQSDGVIYVVENNRNDEDNLLKYREILDEAKVEILGAILNKHNHKE